DLRPHLRRRRPGAPAAGARRRLHGRAGPAGAVLLDPPRLRRRRRHRRPDVRLGGPGAGPRAHRALGRRAAARRMTGRGGISGPVPSLSRTKGLPMLRALDNAPAPAIPYYVPAGNECTLFAHAHRNRLPVLLKGPTGCGRTRFVAHMAAELGLPLFTVSCHDDLAAADLTGRYLLKAGETVWVDGPLTRAVRQGGICYLDEVVEARKDVTVVLHPLSDDRRILPLERTGEE